MLSGDVTLILYNKAYPVNPAVNFFFDKAGKWQKEYNYLRSIALKCPFEEQLKWGCPCYVFQQKNVVLIHGFKEYCALLFMKGALLTDTDKLLIQQSPRVQSARQIRFNSLQQIMELEPLIKKYLLEAIEIEKSGLKVPMKKTAEYNVPTEFQEKLDHVPELKAAFESLTPGRQKAYLLHFGQPKQSKTREARVVKYIPRILEGKGLNDE